MPKKVHTATQIICVSGIENVRCETESKRMFKSFTVARLFSLRNFWNGIEQRFCISVFRM